MADSTVDGSFVALAADLRPRLSRCARLLHPGGDDAPSHLRPLPDQVTDQALARTYAEWGRTDPVITAFRALIAVDWSQIRSGARATDRFTLVDITPPRTGSLADDLAALDLGSRRAVVLSLVGGLSSEQVAAVLDRSPREMSDLLTEAVRRLARTDPSRLDATALGRQLRALAGAGSPAGPAEAEADLSRGRQLVRRAQLRRGVTTAAVAVALVLLSGLAVRVVAEPSATSAPIPAPTPTTSRSERHIHWCDTDLASCRTAISQRWRARTAAVVSESLDRDGRYFSGLGIGSVTLDSRDYWQGGDGAFGLVLHRPRDGATGVYVQLSTSRQIAGRCGRRVKKRCDQVQFMNGNRYLIAGSSAARGGVEIQYASDTGQVITIVAQDSGEGKALEVTAADLVTLVQDPRLRLPRR